jgi:YggT family protein
MPYPDPPEQPNGAPQPPYDEPNQPMEPPLNLQPERRRLQHESARHGVARRVTVVEKFVQTIYYLVAALQLLLGLRFFLRLTAANPDNTFASVIYGLSEPFTKPFSTLFISPTFDGSNNIFDVNVLVAMAAYLALMFLFVWFIRIIANR